MSTYKIVAEFSNPKGRGWLCQYLEHGPTDDWVHYELHLIIGRNKTVIIDEKEFPFILEVMTKATKKAEAEAERFYAAEEAYA